MKRSPRRKGVVLFGVIFLIAIVLGLLSILTMHSGLMYRQRRAEDVRNLAKAMADSGAAYARVHFSAAPATMPSEPIELDASQLLPKNVTGSLLVTFVMKDGRQVCEVTAHAESGTHEATDSVSLTGGKWESARVGR